MAPNLHKKKKKKIEIPKVLFYLNLEGHICKVFREKTKMI